MNTTLPSLRDESAPSDPAITQLVAAIGRERWGLHQAQELLGAQEQNLREYEARLRALLVEIDAGKSAPARAADAGDPALADGWAKLHRARELLDAEEAYLRNDRLAVHDREVAVKAREEAVALREQQLAEEAALAAEAAVTSERSEMSLAKLTRTPFDFARRILRTTPPAT